MTGRSFVLSVMTVLAVLGVGLAYLEPKPDTLPAPLQLRVDRHETTYVTDTAAVHRLEREKGASRRRELAAAASARISDSIAAAKDQLADSLEAIARTAHTSADSARAWQAAYLARTLEAEQLGLSRDSARAESRELRGQRDSTVEQSAIWKRRALEGDSIIRELRPLAAQGSRRWRAGIAIGGGCGGNGCGPQVTAGATYEVRLPSLSLPFTRRPSAARPSPGR